MVGPQHDICSSLVITQVLSHLKGSQKVPQRWERSRKLSTCCLEDSKDLTNRRKEKTANSRLCLGRIRTRYRGIDHAPPPAGYYNNQRSIITNDFRQQQLTLQITLCDALLFHFCSVFNSLLTCLLGLSPHFPKFAAIILQDVTPLSPKTTKEKTQKTLQVMHNLHLQSSLPKPPYEQNMACRTSCSSKVVG